MSSFKKLEDDIIHEPKQNTSTPAESPHVTLLRRNVRI